VLAYFWGPAADLAFRRGWTHGILALVVWPFVLTGGLILVGRAMRRIRSYRHPERSERAGAVPAQLLLLSAIAILSHPALDTLNTYGVRWLMPFSGRWFYGDTLFIVDPWVWLALAIGVVLSRPARGFTRPARIALWSSLAYASAMAVSGLAARQVARAELTALTGAAPERLMLSPMPANPFRRSVVAQQGETYRLAAFRWLDSPHLEPGTVRMFPRGQPDHPAVRAAAATTLGRRFLGWARFPAFQIEPAGGNNYVVHIVDLRYADRPGARFGSVSIPVSATSYSDVIE
jgi:inner membrane protein